MEQKVRKIIEAHNQMIEVIQNAEITCNLFRGVEVWHKIVGEGAKIADAAQSIGINAVVNMQTGFITVQSAALTEARPESAISDGNHRPDLCRENKMLDTQCIV